MVKWKGYSDAENSWQPRANVANSAELVSDFHKKYPNKPKPNALIRGIVLPMTEEIKDSLKPMFEFTKPDVDRIRRMSLL